MDLKPSCRSSQEKSPSRSTKCKVPSLRKHTSQKAGKYSEESLCVHALLRTVLSFQQHPDTPLPAHLVFVSVLSAEREQCRVPGMQDTLQQPSQEAMGSLAQSNPDHRQSLCVIPQYKFTVKSQEPIREYLKLGNSFSSLFFYALHLSYDDSTKWSLAPHSSPMMQGLCQGLPGL